MKLDWLISKNKRRGPFVVIDIGSASVGGALIYPKNSSDKTSLVMTDACRFPVKLVKELSLQIFIKSLSESLNKVVNKIQASDNYSQPQAVFVFLPSIFVVSRTRVINHQSPGRDFSVNRKLVKKLVDGSKKEFQDKWPKLFPAVIDDQTVELDDTVLEVRLNGYKINNPINKQANQLSLTHYYSLTSEAIKKKFNDQMLLWPDNAIEYHSFGLAYYRVMQYLNPEEQDVILMDVTGELSDLYLVRGGLLLNNSSFPIGKNCILRQLAECLNTTGAEVYSTLTLFKQGKLEKRSYEKIEKALEGVRKEWLAGLVETLEILQGHYLLPEKLMIMGDDIVCQIFTDWLNREPLEKFTLSHQSIEAQYVKPRLFSDHYLSGSHRDEMPTEDPFLLTAGLFCKYWM